MTVTMALLYTILKLFNMIIDGRTLRALQIAKTTCLVKMVSWFV